MQEPLEKRPRALVVGVGDDLLGRADLDELPFIHEVDAVSCLAGECHLMGDHDHRAALVGEALHHLEHLANKRRVQRACRFVEQQHLGLHREGPGDGHALPLTAGQAGRIFVALLPQPDLGQVRLGQFGRLFLVHPLQMDRRLDDVPDHGQMRKEVELLEQHPGPQT